MITDSWNRRSLGSSSLHFVGWEVLKASFLSHLTKLGIWLEGSRDPHVLESMQRTQRAQGPVTSATAYPPRPGATWRWQGTNVNASVGASEAPPGPQPTAQEGK